MSNLHLKKFFLLICSCLLTACAPLVPDNYLGPSSMSTSQKINNQWVRPRLIPISAQMLESPEGQALLRPAMQPQAYRIGAYDNLNIIVWGHPELSTVATSSAPLMQGNLAGNNFTSIMSSNNATNSNPAILVQTDGTIFYPYVGTLKVSGLDIAEVQRKISRRLSVYIKHPQVTVQVAKFRNRNAFVLGEVKIPGMQPLTDKPLSLMEAISNAGNIDPASADPKHIFLIRGPYQHPDIFWLDAQSPQALLIAEQFPLQENDIVYVSGASLNGINHFLNTILPSLTTYIIAKNLH